MIKAVIFDCFGVLVTDGWIDFCHKYVDSDPEISQQAHDAVKRVDAGIDDYDWFFAELSRLSGQPAQAVRDHVQTNHLNQKLFDFIESYLKPDYKIGMLSNVGDNQLDRLFSQDHQKLFDEIVLSYQVGQVKPAPIMYETVASKLGLTVEECVFIDDQPRFCDGARQVGMKAIDYENPMQAIEDIKAHLNA
ncbi:MAG: HAD-IA family hydrolase [bacterium]|nr:HAD-IA family hydrolase [bacterium]MDN5835218.1 HAD-IA family hydrolase [bacterium]